MTRLTEVIVLIVAIAAGIVGFEAYGFVVAAVAQLVCIMMSIVFLVGLFGRRRDCRYPREYEPGCR
jgi:hypothetical protein